VLKRQLGVDSADEAAELVRSMMDAGIESEFDAMRRAEEMRSLGITPRSMAPLPAPPPPATGTGSQQTHEPVDGNTLSMIEANTRRMADRTGYVGLRPIYADDREAWH
jgi:hypothetical protein